MYPATKPRNERNKSVHVRSKKEEEEERKKLIEKLAVSIKMKYGKMFREIAYEIRDLITDLNEIVKVTEIPFEAYLIQMEKAILTKVANKPKVEVTEKAKNNVVTDMKKINGLIKEPVVPKDNNPSSKRGKALRKGGKSVSNMRAKNNATLDTDNNTISKLLTHNNTNDDKAYQSEKTSIKIEEIKMKRDDEWAKLANYNYNKYQEELQKLKAREEEKKRVIRENLAKQILEKQNFQQKEKEMDQIYLKQHGELLNKQDLNEKKKKEEIINKIKSEKEVRDKIVQESKQVKKKVEEKEEKEDKKFLDKIQMDMMVEQEKLNKKKLDERDMYRRLIKENEERLKLKKEEKEKEKQENIKALEQYSKLIEKQEQDRLNQNKARLDRISNLMEKFGESVKVDEYQIKLREEKRFLKEIEEKEKRELEREKEEKLKKKQINLQVKSTLDQQIYEKKNHIEEIKNKDKEYEREVNTQINKFEMERKQKMMEEKERTKKYKEDLTNQLKEKAKYKAPSMDETEKLINRIGELNKK